MAHKHLVKFLTHFFISISLLSIQCESAKFSTTYSAKDFSRNVTDLLDGLLANYDKRIRPGHGGKYKLANSYKNLKFFSKL